VVVAIRRISRSGWRSTILSTGKALGGGRPGGDLGAVHGAADPSAVHGQLAHRDSYELSPPTRAATCRHVLTASS
jgi:hypothetical protein